MIAAPLECLAYPPAPRNGGHLARALPKVGAGWLWQPKIDDWRGVVHTPSGTVWNQYGQRSSLAEQGKLTAALEQLQELSGTLDWLDVGLMNNRHDMMRGSIVVLDWMTPWRPLAERRDVLGQYLRELPLADELLRHGSCCDQVFLINDLPPTLTPLEWFVRLQEINAGLGRKFYEGVVAKRCDSSYPLAQSAKVKHPFWVKHRFDQ